MILKFVLKNLILVAALALAINWFIRANVHMFSKSTVGHATQFQELTQEEKLPGQEMLN